MTECSTAFFEGIYSDSTSVGLKRCIATILAHSDDLEKLYSKLFSLQKEEEISVLPHSRQLRDYRLLNISLVNVRAYPFNERMPYGIDLSDNGYEASSAFVVGNNGFGKSSIYCALEYLYSGRCSYAQRLGIPPKDYLTNVFAEEEGLEGYRRINVIGKMPDGLYLQSREGNPMGTPAAFTSDYDIECLERSEDNLFTYFLKSQGYDDVLNVQNKVLEAIHDLQKEQDWLRGKLATDERLLTVSDYQEIKKSLMAIVSMADEERGRLLRFRDEHLLDECLDGIKSETSDLVPSNELFTKSWEELIGNVKLSVAANDAISQIGTRLSGSRGIGVSSSEVDDYVRHLKQLYKTLDYFYSKLAISSQGWDEASLLRVPQVFGELEDAYNELDERRRIIDFAQELERVASLIQTMNELAETIEKRLTEIVRRYCVDYGPFIEDSLSSFSVQGEVTESFKLVAEGNILRLVLGLQNSSEKVEISPRSYFNTFRFKLYALSLRLSLAFAYMKENNVLLPIVIDDVFSASDFENSLKIEQFVYKVYEVYEKMLHFSQPLQLILLTHDEMIQSSFRRGAKLTSRPYICGRLYPYWKFRDIQPYSRNNLGFYNLLFHYSSRIEK
jgi:hypothetical protein